MALICRVLGVSCSGWHTKPRRVRPTLYEVQEGEFLVKIGEIHSARLGTYGSPRVHAQLSCEDFEVERERVARLMHAPGLQGRVRRRFLATTHSKHDRPVAPNSMDRRFRQETSDAVWCADITYLPTAAGRVYLAAIIVQAD